MNIEENVILKMKEDLKNVTSNGVLIELLPKYFINTLKKHNINFYQPTSKNYSYVIDGNKDIESESCDIRECHFNFEILFKSVLERLIVKTIKQGMSINLDLIFLLFLQEKFYGDIDNELLALIESNLSLYSFTSISYIRKKIIEKENKTRPMFSFFNFNENNVYPEDNILMMNYDEIEKYFKMSLIELLFRYHFDDIETIIHLLVAEDFIDNFSKRKIKKEISEDLTDSDATCFKVSFEEANSFLLNINDNDNRIIQTITYFVSNNNEDIDIVLNEDSDQGYFLFLNSQETDDFNIYKKYIYDSLKKICIDNIVTK